MEINVAVNGSANGAIPIGRQGEKKARQIVFDLSWMVERFGDGTAVLMHQRSQDGLPYQVEAVQDGTTLTWTVTDIDTAFVGYGKAEIRWTVGDALAKTVTYKTRVMESITGDTVIPDPYQSWYDQLVETVGEVAVEKGTEAATETATEVATTVAQTVAEEAASSYAQQAQEAAQTATEKATAAQTAATQAASSASAASDSAQSAQASAESAARSAEALSGLSAVMTASGEGTVTLNVALQEG